MINNNDIVSNGTIINDRYEIKDHLGYGASADVFRAIDTLENKEVALKIEKPTADFSSTKKRFEMEAKFIKEINHKNIANVFDYFV